MRGNTKHLMTLALVLTLTAPLAVRAGDQSEGGATFTIVSAVPASARCGGSPAVLEVTMAGTGVDVRLGPFVFEQSMCLDQTHLPEYWDVFDGQAVQVFAGGDELHLTVEDHRQTIDADTCVGYPEEGKVRSTVTGGTGAFQGARGGMRANYASPQEYCYPPGLAPAKQIWYTLNLLP